MPGIAKKSHLKLSTSRAMSLAILYAFVVCPLVGCTYPSADNYDAGNTSDDGSCVFSGCTDSLAFNYNVHANNDDGSCDFEPCTGNGDCPFDTNGDGEIGSADLLEFLIAYGSICEN